MGMAVCLFIFTGRATDLHREVYGFTENDLRLLKRRLTYGS